MRLYVRAEDRRPDPPPLDTDLRRPILVGIGVWTALFLLALAYKGRLDDRGLDWWVWTPLVGALLGAYGLRVVHVRARSRATPPAAEPLAEPLTLDAGPAAEPPAARQQVGPESAGR